MAEKNVSISFWVRAAPKSWLKYTTNVISKNVEIDVNPFNSNQTKLPCTALETISYPVLFFPNTGLLFITFLCIIVVSLVTSTIIGCKRRKHVKKLKSSKLVQLPREDKSRIQASFPSPIPQKPPTSTSEVPCKKIKK